MNRSLLPALAAGLLAFSACNSADKTTTASQPATTPPAENAAPPMANTTDTAMTAGAPGAAAAPAPLRFEQAFRPHVRYSETLVPAAARLLRTALRRD